MLKSAQMTGFMAYACGLPEYKARVSLGVELPVIHMGPRFAVGSVHKATQKTALYAQLHPFLYTVYEQFFNTFVSVKNRVVHIIHSAYIYETNSKKGIY